VNPAFSALVAKLPRRRFVPLAYRFFIVNLLIFFALFTLSPESSKVWIGRAFYIWTSVFNLFVVSVFWGFMADAFESGQGKRLFGFIGVGGTLGTILGSAIVLSLVKVVGSAALLLISAALLEVAVQCVRQLSSGIAVSAARTGAAPRGDTAIGGGVFEGITRVLRSPYLLGICGYMLLYTIGSTLLYFQQVGIVEGAEKAGDARTALLAKIDVMVNVLTVVVQAFLTGRIMARLGVAATLTIVPLISILGSLGLGFMPSITMLVGFLVLRRAGNFAVARPSREVLYTVVSREEKFKAKNFIDTFVYRLGDQVGAWSDKGLRALGLSTTAIALVAAPVAGLWLLIGWWLGKRQAVLAGDQNVTSEAPAAARA
jgi:AAA family ATP:ADP antiporter